MQVDVTIEIKKIDAHQLIADEYEIQESPEKITRIYQELLPNARLETNSENYLIRANVGYSDPLLNVFPELKETPDAPKKGLRADSLASPLFSHTIVKKSRLSLETVVNGERAVKYYPLGTQSEDFINIFLAIKASKIAEVAIANSTIVERLPADLVHCIAQKSVEK